MKKLFSGSFRNRIFFSLLAAAMIPLILSSVLIQEIFRSRQETQARSETGDQLGELGSALSDIFGGIASSAEAAEKDRDIRSILQGGSYTQTEANRVLFSLTENVRDHAQFDLYGADGLRRCSTENVPAGAFLPADWGILKRAAETEKLCWSASETPGNLSEPLYTGASRITDGDGNVLGFLVVSLYEKDLRDITEGKHSPVNTLFLVSRYFRPVFCEEPSLADEVVPVLRNMLLSGGESDAAEGDFLYGVSYNEASELYAVIRSPQVFTESTRRLFYTVSSSAVLLGFLLAVLLSLSLSRQLSKPVMRLHRAIGEITQDNLDARAEVSGDDEFSSLAVRFNDMTAALKRNREELIRNQKELNEAQIRMLQAQLNPHFLGNTLDTMKWLGRINRVPQISEMSADLADILRFCISPEEFVTFERELEVLGRYIDIQKLRLSGRIRFEIDVPEELKELMVPKMILQPLAENAIVHGMDGVEQGVLRVEARETEDGMLRIRIEDNGCGIPKEMEGPYRPSESGAERSHFGLYNVDTILKKHYGAPCGLTLENRKDAPGAAVTALLKCSYSGGTNA